MLLLAEIGDKMPTVAGNTVWACGIALAGFLISRMQFWLILLPLGVAVLIDYAMVQEISDLDMRSAVLTELGWQYFVGQFAGWNLPFLIALAVARRRPSTRAGCCYRCGYDLTENASSVRPECGQSVEPRT